MIDGRSAEAKFMKAVRDDLTKHLGGRLTVPQKLLVDRVATLSLRIRLLDRMTLSDAGLSEKNAREAAAWENTLRRTLTTLGLDGVKPQERSLDDVRALGKKT